MQIINAYEHIFPVVAGSYSTDSQKNRVFTIQNVYGSAFSIAGDCFITAAHVIKEASVNQWWGLGYVVNDVWTVAIALAYDYSEAFDLGFMRVDIPSPKVLFWSLRKLLMLEDVKAVGYPYAFNHKKSSINVRGFAGRVVSDPTFYRLKGKPRVYELSFQCPRGLSGAPLLIDQSDTLLVSGIVIGNESTEMTIFSDREVLNDGTGTRETIVERFEALQLGIALIGNEVTNVSSTTLGCSLLEHLNKHNLVKGELELFEYGQTK